MFGYEWKKIDLKLGFYLLVTDSFVAFIKSHDCQEALAVTGLQGL
jgi:hypothetical protein